jgi:hypothetical protein
MMSSLEATISSSDNGEEHQRLKLAHSQAFG